jgi:hypothetical protein
MIRKFILVLFCFFCSFFVVFAETSLELGVSKTEVSMNESFQLNIIVQTDSNLNNRLNIKWLEKFDSFSNQSSDRISIVNGKQNVLKTVTLSLYPSSTGSFVLWPAEIQVWDDIFTSRSMTIHVVDEKELDIAQIVGNGEGDRENTEFHGVKENRFSFLDFGYMFLVVFLLIVVLVFLIRSVLKHMKTKEVSFVNEESSSDRLSLLKKKLKVLISQIEVLSSSEFYRVLNGLFKDYLSVALKQNIATFTYDEIKKLDASFESAGKDKKVFQLFEESYLLEFSSVHDDADKKAGIIKDFLKLI